LHAFLQYNNYTNVFSEANSSAGFVGGGGNTKFKILTRDYSHYLCKSILKENGFKVLEANIVGIASTHLTRVRTVYMTRGWIKIGQKLQHG
jgi:hypothetical protein